MANVRFAATGSVAVVVLSKSGVLAFVGRGARAVRFAGMGSAVVAFRRNGGVLTFVEGAVEV